MDGDTLGIHPQLNERLMGVLRRHTGEPVFPARSRYIGRIINDILQFFQKNKISFGPCYSDRQIRDTIATFAREQWQHHAKTKSQQMVTEEDIADLKSLFGTTMI